MFRMAGEGGIDDCFSMSGLSSGYRLALVVVTYEENQGILRECGFHFKLDAADATHPHVKVPTVQTPLKAIDLVHSQKRTMRTTTTDRNQGELGSRERTWNGS